MRKTVVVVAALAVLAASCSRGTSTSSSQQSFTSASDCAKHATLLHSGQLTLGTDNPAFQPWFAGAKGAGKGPWKADPNQGTGNPYTGQGFEGSVAYAVAKQLGFSDGQLDWVAVPFGNSFKPGDKPFDFYIGQVSFRTERAQAVDFSGGYYNVQQALVANKGTPITQAKTFADLKGFKLGAQLGTTSYQYIIDNIKPSHQPSVFDNSNDVIAALNAGQIDGYLVDAPTAYVNVLIGEAKHGVVVGQFPTLGAQEYFGLVLPKGSALTQCTTLAIGALKKAGTLDALQKQWLKDITFPVIQPS